jgi:hypothetical protein
MDINIARDIKNTVLELVADFKDNIFTKPLEQGDLLLVEFFFKKTDEKTIADRIVKHVLPYKKKIEKRKVKFFLIKKNEIFANLPTERVEYFANLVQKTEDEGGMSQDDKNAVWAYFDTLIELAEQYKKKK